MSFVSDVSHRLSRLKLEAKSSYAFPDRMYSLNDQIKTIFHLIPKEPIQKEDAIKHLEILSIHTEALKEKIESPSSISYEALVDLPYRKTTTLQSHIQALDLETPAMCSPESDFYLKSLPRHESKALMIRLSDKIENLLLGLKAYVVAPLRLIDGEKTNPLSIGKLKLPRSSSFFVRERMHNVHYVPKKLLGSGSFGDVWLIRGPKQAFAYKKLNSVENAAQTFKNEALLYMQLDHPNIMKLEAVTDAVCEDEIHLIMEFVRGQALVDIIENALTEDELINIFKQVAFGMEHIHSQGFIHKDLKIDNVLYDTRTKSCKIFDFGLSSAQHERYQKPAGTYYYMAPELLDSKAHSMRSEKLDVWSYGVMMYQMLYKGELPFPKLSPREPRDEYLSRMKLMLNRPCDPQVLFFRTENLKHLSKKFFAKPHFMDLHDLIVECLHGNPQKRPSMKEVIARLSTMQAKGADCAIL